MLNSDQLQIALIARLRTGRPAALRDLALELEVSPAEIRCVIAALRELEYIIEIGPSEAVTLRASPDRMIDTEILAGLNTEIIASELHCYGRIRSTNIRARELAEAGAPDGTIVVAEEQIGGMGRLGRSWASAPGLGIWSTVILRPPGSLEQASGLSLLAALVFAETAERELSLAVGLKWPNDGQIEGRKVLGVLTELVTESGKVEYAICGTGINVAHRESDFPAELSESAVSLAMAAGRPVARVAFYRAFLEQFDESYRRFRGSGIDPFLPAYRARSVLLGREVSVRQGRQTITGRAVAIDDSGALIVRSDGEDIIVYSGDATLRP